MASFIWWWGMGKLWYTTSVSMEGCTRNWGLASWRHCREKKRETITAEPNNISPWLPPIKFLDGNGLHGASGWEVEAKDCEIGRGKVGKAWGNGDERVVAKEIEGLFNIGASEEYAKETSLRLHW